MSDTQRFMEAAAALSRLLHASRVPHAFYGGVLVAFLSENPHATEIFCIVEHGHYHPFRRVRDSLANCQYFTTISSPWTNRLYTTYRRVIPSVDIEILPAGEAGPRRLDSSTVTKVHDIPFLSVSEFIRAKLNSWMIRTSECDAQDIMYLLSRYWNRVDINRISEQDMKQFVDRNPTAAPPWTAIKRKYRT